MTKQAFRCSILIIGSLLWEEGDRKSWRDTRLDSKKLTHVKAPISYGRTSSSRSNTFTMIFNDKESMGQAALLPCINEIGGIADLANEAEALWTVEDRSAAKGSIHKSWGCVGALFGENSSKSSLPAEWSAYFQEKNPSCFSVLNKAGILDIPWPNMAGGQPADTDIILATVTKPDVEPPTAQSIADGWLSQNESEERYFFHNVKHGIRTADDGPIWRRIEDKSPKWLEKDIFRDAIGILRSEAKDLDRST